MPTGHDQINQIRTTETKETENETYADKFVLPFLALKAIRPIMKPGTRLLKILLNEVSFKLIIKVLLPNKIKKKKSNHKRIEDRKHSSGLGDQKHGINKDL